LMAVLGLACSEELPLPTRVAMAEPAACRDAAPPQQELRELEGMTVLSARPNCHLDYCSGVNQVWGISLVVRPPEGTTLEQFTRDLRCHNLRALSGEGDASRIPDDPYGLPGSWLDIDVKAQDGNFVVVLNGDTVADNLLILRRARAFAAAHRPTTSAR